MPNPPDRPEILFAHAYLVEADRHPLGFMHPLPPLQPAEIAAWISQETDAQVELWDSTFRVGVRSFEVAVSRRRPRITWLYTHPTTRNAALRMLALARRSGAAVIAGGPDAGLRPSVYLKAGADAVVSGEGEDATVAFVLALRSAHYRATPALLSRIPGIHYLDEQGSIRRGAGKPRLVDLARMPRPLRPPAQTRIQIERWLDHGRPRTLAISSARGCPVACGFCSRTVFSRPYRRRAPQDVVSEIAEVLQAFEVDRLRFSDEVFLFDPHWLRELASNLRERSLQVAFEGSAHPSHVDLESLDRLAEVGLRRLDLLAASGSASLLGNLDWSYRPGDVYRAATAIRSAGIGLGLQVMVGLPGEQRSDLDASMEMVGIVQPDGVEVTRVDPGSPALFRMDWERVVEGPVADLGRDLGALPPAVLDSAVAWMHSVGAREEGGPVERAQGLLSVLRRPVLRAMVRMGPGRRRRGGRSSDGPVSD